MINYNFHNNWLDVSSMYKNGKTTHAVQLPLNFFNDLQFDRVSLKQYRIEAAKKCLDSLGAKPVLMFSGGANSQAMMQCFIEADLSVDTVIFVYNKDFNKHDVESARFFSKVKKFNCAEIQFDILNFLQKENFNIGMRCKSANVEFNLKYKMAEILKDMGYTGVCFGGFVPTNINYDWGSNFNYDNCFYTSIKDKLDIKFQGNFLSYTPELSWSIALLTEKLHNTINFIEDYEKKIHGYRIHGFEVYGSIDKTNELDLVRKYYAAETNDDYFFEGLFEEPLYKQLVKNELTNYKLDLSEKQLTELMTIYKRNFNLTAYTTPLLNRCCP